MKALAVILCCVISFLIAHPTIQAFAVPTSAEETCSDACCSSEGDCSDQDPGKKTEGSCCPGGVCNPFESCYCCSGWNETFPSMQTTIASLKVDYNSYIVTEPALGFRSDCFHPPELFDPSVKI